MAPFLFIAVMKAALDDLNFILFPWYPDYAIYKAMLIIYPSGPESLQFMP